MRIITLLLWKAGLIRDRGAWIVPERVFIRSYPRRARDLADLVSRGIGTVINLDERKHDQDRLREHGLVEVHIPVPDFTALTPDQIEHGIAAIEAGLEGGVGVVVHCRGGLGRSGTLAACYLVHRGMTAEEATVEVRQRRPGAIETRSQVDAIEAYAQRQSRQ